MKCSDVQAHFARVTGGELAGPKAEILKAHLAECAECRDWLAFHRSLEASLNRPVELPMDLQEQALMRAASKKSWLLTRWFGDPKMRKLMISSTTLAAAAVGLFLLMPRHAAAETPLEAFNHVGMSFAEAAAQGQIKIVVQGNGDGTVKTTGTLNGNPLPSSFPFTTEVKPTDDPKVIDVVVEVRFKPETYEVIRYGSDKNTLELLSKANSKQKVEVALDPKTRAPKAWTTLNQVAGEWLATSHTPLKNLKRSNREQEFLILVRPTVRIYLDQRAEFTLMTSGG